MEKSNIEEYIGGKLQMILNTLFDNKFVSRDLEESRHNKVKSYLGYYGKSIFEVLCQICLYAPWTSYIHVKHVEGYVNVDDVKNLLVSSGVNCQYDKIKRDPIKVNLMLDKTIKASQKKGFDFFEIYGDNIEEKLRTFWSYTKAGKLKNYDDDTFFIQDLSVPISGEDWELLLYDIIPPLLDDFMDGNLSAEKLLEKSLRNGTITEGADGTDKEKHNE